MGVSRTASEINGDIVEKRIFFLSACIHSPVRELESDFCNAIWRMDRYLYYLY